MRIIFIFAAALLSGASAEAGNPDIGREKICPMIYQPVCAASGGKTQTFSNACLAEGAGFTVVAQGPCGEGPERILRFCGKDGRCLR